MAKVLVGFMGAGKTTVARLLDPNYIDMDEVITQRIGMSIAQYFQQYGEQAFREIESEVLAELIHSDHVIATGGGVVESKENRRLLAENPTTIYLKADLETLKNRIVDDTVNVRPLFIQQKAADFEKLFEHRQALYHEVAHQVIIVDHKTPKEIVEEIQ